jgi:hypothetical protein
MLLLIQPISCKTIQYQPWPEVSREKKWNPQNVQWQIRSSFWQISMRQGGLCWKQDSSCEELVFLFSGHLQESVGDWSKNDLVQSKHVLIMCKSRTWENLQIMKSNVSVICSIRILSSFLPYCSNVSNKYKTDIRNFLVTHNKNKWQNCQGRSLYYF